MPAVAEHSGICNGRHDTVGSALNIQYGCTATQNNGKITSQSDVMSGDQIAYTYDALNRIASAQTTQIGGLLTKGQGIGEPQRISAVEGHLGTEQPKGRFQSRSREFRVTSVLRETA